MTTTTSQLNQSMTIVASSPSLKLCRRKSFRQTSVLRTLLDRMSRAAADRTDRCSAVRTPLRPRMLFDICGSDPRTTVCSRAIPAIGDRNCILARLQLVQVPHFRLDMFEDHLHRYWCQATFGRKLILRTQGRLHQLHKAFGAVAVSTLQQDQFVGRELIEAT